MESLPSIMSGEKGEQRRYHQNSKKKGTRGLDLKRSVAVLGVCLTAVLVLVVVGTGTKYRLCGHTGTSAIRIDDGRYVHMVANIPETQEKEGGRSKSGTATPVIRGLRSATTTTTAATATVLDVFQVHQPVLTPDGATLDSAKSIGGAACQVLLMDHVFAYSYGEPYVGTYEPPSCDFNRVVMNFTVVSEGKQYDRLALMYLNDTEVWRTSTAEPKSPPGIRWTYLKDMTPYLALWNAPQKLIFDLGNLVNDVYTGSFNTTLTATFFLDDDVAVATAPPADLIIPISKRQSASDGVSQFTLPADNATNTIAAFPRNAHRAVFSVSANGQSNEEFWWSNVPNSSVDAFAATAGAFPGYSPWREVQVYIDDQLAGVQWPFPVVFTGGVVPSLHRPVVGPDAFDLKEHEIDITPWLGVLSDGNSHTFSIYVAGLVDDVDDDDGATVITQTVGSSWYVTGKIFVWLDDDADSITTGTPPTVEAGPPSITVTQALTQNANETANQTLTYDTYVSRSYTVSAQVTSQNRSGTVSWTQRLTYSNKGYVWAQGYAQLNDFLISGSDEATAAAAGASPYYKTEYEYPLWCNTSYSTSAEGNLTLYGQLVQGQQVYVEGAAVYPDGLEAFSPQQKGTNSSSYYTGSLVNTTKDGEAYYFRYADGTNSSGYGTTDQVFSFGGFLPEGVAGSVDTTPDELLYYQHVAAASDGSLASDTEILFGGHDGGASSSSSSSAAASDANENAYPQAPLNGGGHGGPRLFMNRQDVGR